MLMPNATYSFLAEAVRTAGHPTGFDAVTSSKNVTLAEKLTR